MNGYKRIFAILFAVVLLFLAGISADAGVTSNPRVIDKADLLDDEQEAILTERLNEYSAQQNCDIVFLTEPDMDHEDYSFDGSVEDFADMYYETHGYDTDGVLVLIVLDNGYGSRRIQFSCSGKCMKRLSDEEQDEIIDDIYFDLKSSAYYSAMNSLSYGINDKLTPRVSWYMLPISVIVAFALAMIIMNVMKGKLKSVAMEKGAKNYVRAGSMRVTGARDTYLYSHISRTVKESDSGGSGSSRTSSGGGSHSGTGRNF